MGNVTDPSGAGVPAAQITITNEGTGIETKVTTGAAGTYTVPDLLAGIYTVTAVKEGFKAFHATGIQLLSAQTTRQDVVLEVGTIQQTIEITARAQLVQTDSPTIGGTIQTRELADLPYQTTTMDNLFQLVPGMSQGEVNGNANPAIGGAPFEGSSNFTLNGITTSNPGQAGGGNVTYIGSNEMIAQANLPSIGTMQEFKIDSSVVGADQRSMIGVSVVTKQGTNKFHGTAYEYNENKSTSANSFDLNKYGENEYPFNRNQFGLNIGGPVLKDKLFFFMNYDGIREVHPYPTQINYPSMAMRGGDFSAICDQYSGGVCTESDPSKPNVQLYNPVTGAPFAGNIIDPSLITSQAKTLNAFVPMPTDLTSPGLPNEGMNNWNGAIPLRFGTNNEQARLDSQLGPRDSVVAFFHGSRGYPWFYGYAGPPNVGQWTDHGYNFLNFSGTETHTFSAGIVNEFRVGWDFALRHKYGQNLGFEPWTIFPGMPTPPNKDGGLPGINVSGYGSTNNGGMLGDVGLARGIQDTVDWVDNLTIVHGRHTIKTGFEETGWKEDDAGGLSGAPPLGSLNFYGQWTGGEGLPGIAGSSPGNAFADYLLGDIASSSYGVNVQPYLLSREYDAYVTDTWKASSRLTVSAGLRYEYQRPWTYRDHNATFFDITKNKLILQENSSTPTLPTGADPGAFAAYPFETTNALGASLNYMKGDTNNWAPRLGFAYRLSGDNRTVIRGGYGVYYAFNGDWYGYRDIQFNAPWGATNNFSTQLPGQPVTPYLPDLTFANAFPKGLVGGEPANPSVTMMEPHQINPPSQQWNLTLEHQVGDNWSFRGTYLGSVTRHLTTDYNGGFNINQPYVQQPNVEPQQQVILQPWSSITYIGNEGTSNFNQLQLEAQKRLAHGLMFRTEYDWSSHLTNGNPYTTPQTPWDMKANYGNDPLQYRHRFLLYYIYEMPVGRGRKYLGNMNKIEDGVLGGWRVSGITTYHSGDPLTAALDNPGTKIGWVANRPDRVSGPLYSTRQSGHDTIGGVQWFNTSAFAPPQPWTWGNAASGQVFGPGFGDWDVSVLKQFRLPKGEANRLEFKIDFFNLPNHYNLGDPSMGIQDTRDGGAPDQYSGKIYYGANGYAPRLVQIGLRLMF